MSESRLDASITASDRWPGEYHLAGSTGTDEFYYQGSLEAIEAFAQDLLEQIRVLRAQQA